MSRLFDLVVREGGDGEKEPSISVGIRLEMGGKEAVCPVSEFCRSAECLQREVERLREDLEGALEKALSTLKGESGAAGPVISSETSPEDLWRSLASIPDESAFMEEFNALEEAKRREVAEYVLTSCNIFSGRPAAFSSRYDAETAFLE